MEGIILREIEERTGRSAWNLAGFNTTDADTARAVLPILAEWVPRVPGNYRAGIFRLFEAPHCRAFLDQMLQWWEQEESLDALQVLQWQLCKVDLGEENAERVWRILHRKENEGHYYRILAKLAELTTTGAKAKEEFVQALESGGLHYAGMEEASRVKDRRILAWFEARTESPDRLLRKLARRAVGKRRKLPKGLMQIEHGPPRGRPLELDSAEVDLVDATAWLKDFEKRFGFKAPAFAKRLDFVEAMEQDCWYVTGSFAAAGTQVCLWFRLEDFDTLEIALAQFPLTPRAEVN